MFDWVKLRIYSRFMTKAEHFLIRACVQQWKDGNEFPEWAGLSTEEYFLEGFVAGWVVSQVVSGGAPSLDALRSMVIQEEETMEVSERQGKG